MVQLHASPGPEHDAFLAWARDRGVVVDGVTPASFPASGLGVIKDVRLPLDATVHGRLAAYLTIVHDKPDRPHVVWEPVWPKKDDFDLIMPLRWDEHEKKQLTPHAKELLANQQSKIDKDWDLLQTHLPNHEDPSCRELFTYYWLIVNTRTFYWDYPTNTRTGKQANKRRKLAPDDCMALCPFMEYFNHADEGCVVDHDVNEFTVTCNRDYEEGQEVYLSYGSHSNDFLQVEYGFILASNKWDETKLDHIILPQLSKTQKTGLEETGFLGNYTIDSTQTCYRTQAALRSIILPERNWRQFVEGWSDGEKDQKEVYKYCVQLLEQYERDIAKVQKTVEELQEGYRKDTLKRRWEQIKVIVGDLKLKLES
ncbi:uncharacterized protein K452DRAFT_263947 [Aplosporella prunicola CBS 121167]|uniref:Uncharacterized protein n=1 Tax=Aplosporella prunicola CBS 121167 TaxID=1176127 RepID=A0A6A6BQH7_9PEZI|nr:uncharacterized protein K452DRAFT_263947 [Aplosporella prunicola CBS 121167]KAF2146260.1 hypothetical protein K452DRAFT_263947 [Aplosporella prunicola CBS 121167]